MLGKRQLGWVKDSLVDSKATWNVLANQVIMAIVEEQVGPEHKFPMDDWSGYVHERNDLMEFVRDHRIANPIVITGDNHKNWVNDVRVDGLRPESPVVATEFVGTSITSGGNGGENRDEAAQLMAKNPNVRFYNNERGYVRCTITPDTWRSEFRTVPEVTKPGVPANTRATFVVEAGKPGAKLA
jgi:alkaline phosphatase D